MKKSTAAVRLLEIARLLELNPQGLTAKEIYQRLLDRDFETTVRSVYRDIDAISQIFPVKESEARGLSGRRFSLEPHGRVTKTLVLNARELFALYVSRGVLLPLQNTPFFSDLEAVFRKMDELIGNKAREHLTELTQGFQFDPAPKWGLGLNPDILETFRCACAERHTVRAAYASGSSEEATLRHLGPHFLYYSKGGIYLVAEDLESKTLKTYSLPRFQSARMTNVAYDAPVVSPGTHFAGSFGIFGASEMEDVELEFGPDIAAFVSERQWHSSQRVTRLEGGVVRISFSLGITPDFVSWVLSFGDRVSVIRSERLRMELAKEVERLYLVYGARKSA